MSEYPRPPETPRVNTVSPALQVVGATAILIFIAAVFVPIAIPRKPMRSITCMSNIKQISLGLLLYSNDYDSKFPAAATWGEGTLLYMKHRLIFNEPTLTDQQYGYAFNSALQHIAVPDKDAARRPLVFESSVLAWDAADRVQSLPIPPRHGTRNNFGFADGHAKSVEATTLMPP